MGTIASKITSLTIVYSTVHSDADQRKHQSSASLAFVRGIHRWPVNSPHKWEQRGKCLHLMAWSCTGRVSDILRQDQGAFYHDVVTITLDLENLIVFPNIYSLKWTDNLILQNNHGKNRNLNVSVPHIAFSSHLSKQHKPIGWWWSNHTGRIDSYHFLIISFYKHKCQDKGSWGCTCDVRPCIIRCSYIRMVSDRNPSDKHCHTDDSLTLFRHNVAIYSCSMWQQWQPRAAPWSVPINCEITRGCIILVITMKTWRWFIGVC